MQRRAFKMYLHPGQAAAYKRRHDAIWPELIALLKEAGVEDYSIFLDEGTNILFGILKTAKPESLDALPAKDVMQRWWAYMCDIMDAKPDNEPVTVPLTEVFHMD